jgi:hypothetical protein
MVSRDRWAALPSVDVDLAVLGEIPLLTGYATASQVLAAVDEHGAVARWPHARTDVVLLVPPIN